MFIVTVENMGTKFWLRGTTWAFRVERADQFETETAARIAATRAEKFMAPAIKRKYKIESLPV